MRGGLAVCLAFHGRSALSTEVSRQALEQSCVDGFAAAVVPGVSALDCLFADLGLGLLSSGCRIYGTEAFVERGRPDLSSALVLYLSDDSPLSELLALLRPAYGEEQKAVLYEPARTRFSSRWSDVVRSETSAKPISPRFRSCTSRRTTRMAKQTQRHFREAQQLPRRAWADSVRVGTTRFPIAVPARPPRMSDAIEASMSVVALSKTKKPLPGSGVQTQGVARGPGEHAILFVAISLHPNGLIAKHPGGTRHFRDGTLSEP